MEFLVLSSPFHGLFSYLHFCHGFAPDLVVATCRYPSKYLPVISSAIILALLTFTWVMFFSHYDACCTG